MAVHENRRLQGVHTILRTSELCGEHFKKMIFIVQKSSAVIVNSVSTWISEPCNTLKCLMYARPQLLHANAWGTLIEASITFHCGWFQNRYISYSIGQLYHGLNSAWVNCNLEANGKIITCYLRNI